VGHAEGDRVDRRCRPGDGALRQGDHRALGGDGFTVRRFLGLRTRVDCAEKSHTAQTAMAAGGREFVQRPAWHRHVPGRQDARRFFKRDTAMYRRRTAHDSFRLFTPDMDTACERVSPWRADLRQARRAGLVVYYQPQIDVETGQMIRMEACVGNIGREIVYPTISFRWPRAGQFCLWAMVLRTLRPNKAIRTQAFRACEWRSISRAANSRTKASPPWWKRH
jgi:predicted signal transduction protein with EAL and GGDEF domain